MRWGTVADEAREIRGVEDLVSPQPGVTRGVSGVDRFFTAKLAGLCKLCSLSGLPSDSGWDWTIQGSVIHKSSILAGRLGLSFSLHD